MKQFSEYSEFPPGATTQDILALIAKRDANLPEPDIYRIIWEKRRIRQAATQQPDAEIICHENR